MNNLRGQNRLEIYKTVLEEREQFRCWKDSVDWLSYIYIQLYALFICLKNGIRYYKSTRTGSIIQPAEKCPPPYLVIFCLSSSIISMSIYPCISVTTYLHTFLSCQSGLIGKDVCNMGEMVRAVS
ncbi:hypothetical protein HDV62DRAFT_313315 [Trichoderma sp. SZMC 28011]